MPFADLVSSLKSVNRRTDLSSACTLSQYHFQITLRSEFELICIVLRTLRPPAADTLDAAPAANALDNTAVGLGMQKRTGRRRLESRQWVPSAPEASTSIIARETGQDQQDRRGQTNRKLDPEHNCSVKTPPCALRPKASDDAATMSWKRKALCGRFKSGHPRCCAQLITNVRQCDNSTLQSQRGPCGRTAAHRPTNFCKNAGLLGRTDGGGAHAPTIAPKLTSSKESYCELSKPAPQATAHCHSARYQTPTKRPTEGKGIPSATRDDSHAQHRRGQNEQRGAMHNKRERPNWEAKASTPETLALQVCGSTRAANGWRKCHTEQGESCLGLARGQDAFQQNSV